MAVNPVRHAYVHVPFCRHRCGYCDFTLVAGRDDLLAAYCRTVSTSDSGTGYTTCYVTGFANGCVND